MSRQVILIISVVCIGTVLGSVDRVIDRMMQKMFVDSMKMSRGIANVPLPKGFWATGKVANYPSAYVNGYRSRPWGKSQSRYAPVYGNKNRFGTSNNIYAPIYSFTRPMQVPTMGQVTSPMSYSSYMPYAAPRQMMSMLRPSPKQIIRGPFMQLNLKVRKPVNKRMSRKYNRALNLTANIEKESVGEVVASWNTEMKEISISGTKNETKIKSFRNSGNIHSHLGSELEGSTLLTKLARGDRRKVQTVPGKSEVNNKSQEKTQSTKSQGKGETVNEASGDALRYKVNQEDVNKMAQDPTGPSVLSLVPIQRRKQFTHISN